MSTVSTSSPSSSSSSSSSSSGSLPLPIPSLSSLTKHNYYNTGAPFYMPFMVNDLIGSTANGTTPTTTSTGKQLLSTSGSNSGAEFSSSSASSASCTPSPLMNTSGGSYVGAAVATGTNGDYYPTANPHHHHHHHPFYGNSPFYSHYYSSGGEPMGPLYPHHSNMLHHAEFGSSNAVVNGINAPQQQSQSIASNNWYETANAANPNTATQIVDSTNRLAGNCLFTKYKIL